jgi:glycosyltransferase involved in cell wall biosynthesis
VRIRCDRGAVTTATLLHQGVAQVPRGDPVGPPRLSVVICSLNGAAGVDRCIRAIDAQTIRPSLELIVVDDGSTDATSEVGRAHGAIVIRHPSNRGLAAARNSGLCAANAPVVAFLDDDCEPQRQWAEQLLAAYEEGVTGVGGPLLLGKRDSFMLGYLVRNNPFEPQESNLAKSQRMLYRLRLYLVRQWSPREDYGRRDVYSFAGGNMSFLRHALMAVGRFDERFAFGAEELDLCMRLARAFPASRLIFVPDARVVHHFTSSARHPRPVLHDALRRSRAYGRGAARLYRKWPSVPPTLFPGPLIVLLMLALSPWLPVLALGAFVIPHVLYPRGLCYAVTRRTGMSLLDAYVQLAQEGCGNVGFAEGWWRFRNLVPEPGSPAARVSPRDEAGCAR